MSVKGLVVIPRRGKSYPFTHLVVAEKYAQYLADQGRGPVSIVSQFTGDVLAVYESKGEG